MAYETTTVAVSKSHEMIRSILVESGADGFAFGEETVAGITYALVSFRHHGIAVKMRVAMKIPDETELADRAQRSRTRSKETLRADIQEQEAKRIWRVLAWNIKARIEAVAEGVETIEQAFLAHIVIGPAGETVYEQLAEHGRVEFPTALPALTAGD